jgi:hypothetical protein
MASYWVKIRCEFETEARTPAMIRKWFGQAANNFVHGKEAP